MHEATVKLTPAELQLLRDALESHQGLAQDTLDTRGQRYMHGTEAELEAVIRASMDLSHKLEVVEPD